MNNKTKRKNIKKKNIKRKDNKIVNDEIKDDYVNNIIKVQSIIRGFLSRKKLSHMICKYIIELFNNNSVIMKDCYYKIMKIMIRFPPAKNENKFIYGKLIEKTIIKTLNKIKNICVELDNNCNIGSQYKNDCRFIQNFSIKASKNISNIIIINKLNKNKHFIINMNFIVCFIIEKTICVFPSNIIEQKYVKNTGSNISFKSSIYNKILKDSDYIYKFPELTKKQLSKLEKCNEISIYDVLYNKYVKK